LAHWRRGATRQDERLDDLLHDDFETAEGLLTPGCRPKICPPKTLPASASGRLTMIGASIRDRKHAGQ
jgi:hypothetical protein